MKHYYLILLCAMLALLLVTGCSVPSESVVGDTGEGTTEEKQEQTEASDEEKVVYISSSGTKIDASKEMLLNNSELIVRGVVVEEYPGKYTNPEADINLKNKHGVTIQNAWETSYLVEIKEVYKGEPYDTERIVVKTWNRIGILPPEDGVKVVVVGEEEQYLEVGSDMLLCLAYDEENALNTDEFGYQIVYGTQGAFITALSNTATAASVDDAGNGDLVFKGVKYIFDPASLPQEIQKAEEYYENKE